ncbi:MAG: ABC transporter substrate-binding protein [Synergistales bacterium]|nr:ABC transporter substrate-binding protein [Synergistales bacterium]
MRRFSALLVTLTLLGSLAVSPAAASSLAEIQERGTLRVAIENDNWGTFHYWENGQSKGLDHDLALAIAQAAGVSLEVIPLPWGDGEAGTISGAWDDGGWPAFNVDMICAAVTINDERGARVAFSTPYFSAGQLVLTLKGNGLTAMNQIKELKVGFQQGTTSDTAARELLAENTLFPLPAVLDVMNALRNKIIDVAVIDSPVALAEGRNDATLFVIEEPLTEEHFGVAMPKDVDPELKTLVDDVVRSKGQALFDKWFK